MDKEVSKLKKELKKQRKEEDKYLEKQKDCARTWWEAFTQLFYKISIDDNNKNYEIGSGKVKAKDNIEKEATRKYYIFKNKKRNLNFAYLTVCIFSVPALAVSVYMKSIAGIFATSLAMMIVYAFIKIIERTHKLGAKKYFKEKGVNKERLNKTIALFAKAKGCSKDDITTFFLGGFQKKRRTFMKLYREQIMGIMFISMLLPSISKLIDEQYESTIIELFSLPELEQYKSILFYVIPEIEISVFDVGYWLMTFLVCIVIQFPMSVIINEIFKIRTTDELFLFFRDCVFEDRIKRARKLDIEIEQQKIEQQKAAEQKEVDAGNDN